MQLHLVQQQSSLFLPVFLYLLIAATVTSVTEMAIIAMVPINVRRFLTLQSTLDQKIYYLRLNGYIKKIANKLRCLNICFYNTQPTNKSIGGPFYG